MKKRNEIHEGDMVTILGVPGNHRVIGLANALFPSHLFAQVRYSCDHGRFKAGDTDGVEAWRCEVVTDHLRMQ